MTVNSDDVALSGTHVLFLDVDHNGATSDGQRFADKPKVYRGHCTVENVVLRYPCGRLELVRRIIPARQCV